MTAAVEVPEALKFLAPRSAPTLPRKWSELVAWTPEQVAQWDASRKEAEEFNRTVHSHNSAVESAWIRFLSDAGVQTRKGSRNSTPAHVRMVIEEIRASAKANRCSSTSLYDCLRNSGIVWPAGLTSDTIYNVSSLQEAIDRVAGIEKQAADRRKSDDETTIYWLSQASKYPELVASDFASVADYVSAIREASREAFAATLDGEEISISCCSECSSWTVGERRCSCGNRRVSLSVEWLASIKEWYYYAEAY